MRTKTKLIDVFDDALSSGIFSSLQSFDVPWKNEGIASQLDLAYFTNYGARQISPLVRTCLDENGKLTQAKQALIASTAYNLYKVNWIKQYNTLLLEYNPIENYSMVETHTGSDTRTETPDDWKETATQTPTDWKTTETQTPTDWEETQTQTPTNWKETETQTPTNWKETETKTPTNWKETETKTPTNWTEAETQTPTDWVETTEGLKADNTAHTANSVYAFNSGNTPAPVSESDAETNSKTTVERTGTFETSKVTSGTFETEVEHSGTFETETEHTGTFETETERTGTFETKTERTGTYETETEQTGTFKTETERTGTYESKTDYDTELTRSGNIGVTTSQQMIESERELWTWNFFQNVVFPDLTKLLALRIY